MPDRQKTCKNYKIFKPAYFESKIDTILKVSVFSIVKIVGFA